MELMSSLLLCALAVALSQALGEGTSIRQLQIIFTKKPNTQVHKQILVNMNKAPLVNSAAAEIQSVFKDISCRNCINCMQRAVKAHERQCKYKMLHVKPILDELYYGVLNKNHLLGKRSINLTNEETHKPKRRGIKRNKAVTVTKYSDENGTVFALKVKELSSKNSTDGKMYTCKVYSVSESLPCDTIDGTTDARKKKVKRDKKSKHKTSTSTFAPISTSKFTATPLKKSEIFNSEVSDSYMPSLEDLY